MSWISGFMKELREKTSAMKPDFWLMGEVIHGEYSRWVNPEMLHSVTNYELHKALYSGHNDHNYFEIAHNVRRLEAVGKSLYTFVDNHDEDRIASKLNHPANLFPVYQLLFTLPGIPSIYYGSEWGSRESAPEHPMKSCARRSLYPAWTEKLRNLFPTSRRSERSMRNMTRSTVALIKNFSSPTGSMHSAGPENTALSSPPSIMMSSRHPSRSRCHARLQMPYPCCPGKSHSPLKTADFPSRSRQTAARSLNFRRFK